MPVRGLPLLGAIPWTYSTAIRRIREGRRGGYAMLALLAKLGLLDRCAPFPLGSSTIQLPLFTTGLENAEVLHIYERDAIAAMASAMKAIDVPCVFVDCGADVGVYSRLLLEHSPPLSKLIAIEPNPRPCGVLKHNLDGLHIPNNVMTAGVASKSGKGQLQTPDYDDNERAFFVTPGIGELDLVTLDDLLGQDSLSPLAVKIDVEGLELDVLRGGEQSIRNAPEFVVQFEAHPTVAKRTGCDPIECLEWLIAAGGKSWTVCEEGADRPFVGLRPGAPFFDQFPEGHIYDVVVTSIPGHFKDGI
jgi:FkbM family methyltransferase